MGICYEDLKRRDPKLVADYEHSLASAIRDPAKPSLSPEVIEAFVRSKLQEREASQLIIKIGQQTVKVREQAEKVLKFILWSNNTVAQALSTQPYAALAWSGVSVLLPVGKFLVEDLQLAAESRNSCYSIPPNRLVQ